MRMKELHLKKAKFLAFVLRHKPTAVEGLTISADGWADVKHFVPTFMTMTELEEIVASDSKGRYEIRNHEGKKQIRCRYGHSINVEIQGDFREEIPELWHATTIKAFEQIEHEGIKNMSRQRVHLSNNKQLAHDVALRYAKDSKDVVILKIVNAHEIEDLQHNFGEIWTASYVAPKNFKKD